MASARARKIWKRTWVGSLLAGVLATLLLWLERSEDGRIPLGIGLLLAGGGAWELARMGRLAQARLAVSLVPALVVVVGFGVLDLLRASEGEQLTWSWLQIAVVGGLAAAGATLRPADARNVVGNLLAVGLALLVTLPLAWLFRIWHSHGAAGLIALVALSKIGDVFGYYVGNAIGKRHPFPGISPGKTTAGCVASLLAGMVAGGLAVGAGWLGVEGRSWGWGCVFGAVINLAAQGGDLLESWVKRRALVKDSGTWFGPSGGILDLVDSLLLSSPVALATWTLLLGGE